MIYHVAAHSGRGDSAHLPPYAIFTDGQISRGGAVTRLAIRLLGVLLSVYVAFAGILYIMMRQSPERFASFMAGLPDPILMITPFPPLWSKAREGTVRVGDAAPDFHLESSDHAQRIRLSSLRGKPVVLIFGSYT